MTTVYKSKFLKANARKEQSLSGSKSYRCHNNDRVIVSDIFLLPGSTVTVKLSENALNIILPVVGMLNISEGNRQLNPEELFCYCGADQKDITIANPFTDETINFLHIGIDKAAHNAADSISTVEKLNVDAKNKMIQGSGAAGCVKIGVYDSRVKDRVVLTNSLAGLFTYVLNGSFDFEERLMEYRDSLYQWEVDEVDFEALSETAIILMIECSPFK